LSLTKPPLDDTFFKAVVLTKNSVVVDEKPTESLRLSVRMTASLASRLAPIHRISWMRSISVSRGKGPGRYESSSIMAIKHIPILVGGLEHGFFLTFQ